MTQQPPAEGAAARLVTGLSLGATMADAAAPPPSPRDEALQLAINAATHRIEVQLAYQSASDLLDRVNKELASIDARLDGPPGRPELAMRKRAAAEPHLQGRIIHVERRRLELEAEQIVLTGKAAEEDRRRAKESERVEAAGRAAQEARLLAQFRAEETEAAAVAERKRFLTWKAKQGLL